MDIGSELEQGKYEKINEILKNEIHKYGKLKKPSELIENMTGEPFNPVYYIKYLTEKFSMVYDIEK